MSDDLNAPAPTDELDAPLGKEPRKEKASFKFRVPITAATGRSCGLGAVPRRVRRRGAVRRQSCLAASRWSWLRSRTRGGADGPPAHQARRQENTRWHSGQRRRPFGARHSEGGPVDRSANGARPGQQDHHDHRRSSGNVRKSPISGNAPADGQAPAIARATPCRQLDDRPAGSTRHGLIPQSAPDGARPGRRLRTGLSYALPGKPDAPRIALVVERPRYRGPPAPPTPSPSCPAP